MPGEDGGVVGRCALGVAHEGPPGYGHGGMSAMLLDEVLGWACAGAGLPGMTVSLEVRHHRPVPLETPLRVRARVTADGVFVTPGPDRARALFPGLTNR